MRIILALFLLLVLVGHASAGCPTGTGGVNWLGGYEIGSDTGTPVGFERPNMAMPNPVTKPDMSMPKPGPVQKTNESTNSSQTANNKTDESLSNTSNDARLNLSGRWSMNLSDGRHLELVLYPVGTVFYGDGNLSENNSTIPLKARGSIGEDSLVRLDIIQVVDGEKYREDVLYKLTIQLSNQTIAGSYSRYGTNGQSAVITDSGTVSGILQQN